MRNFLVEVMESAGTHFLYASHFYICCMMPCIVAVAAELGGC